MIDEQWFRESSTWESVSEVPEFPLQDWAAVKAALSQGDYVLSVDYSAANRLAPSFEPTGYWLWFYVVSTLPYAGIVASVVLAVWLRSWVYALGIPVTVLAFVGGSPVVHNSCGVVRLLWIMSVAACILSIACHQGQWAYVSGLFACVVLLVGSFYTHNADATLEAARQHEAVFLFLLERKWLGIKNARTGERWHQPARNADT